jgi:hypothetical protein
VVEDVAMIALGCLRADAELKDSGAKSSHVAGFALAFLSGLDDVL